MIRWAEHVVLIGQTRKKDMLMAKQFRRWKVSIKKDLMKFVVRMERYLRVLFNGRFRFNGIESFGYKVRE
jgi:hypothetical protein